MTADTILAMTTPEELFTVEIDCTARGSLISLERAYKSLAKQWHPDVSNDVKSKDVFAHISMLHRVAVDKLHSGAWGYGGAISIKSIKGNTYKIKYQWAFPFELGITYVADQNVCYILKEEYSKLFNNGVDVIRGLRFPTAKSSVSDLFPKIREVFTADDGSLVLVLTKTPEVIPLEVALNYFNGSFEPKVAAWIISCLHNTNCALKYNKLMHGDISTSTYFISPQYHTGLLLGGWWYATPRGQKMVGVPNRSYAIMPLSQKQSKKADPYLDAELLRLTARELLGDASGITLKAKGVPELIERWVNIPSNRDAYSDYGQWGEVLTKVFGPRKFIPMDIDTKKAYKMMPRRM